MLTNAPVTAIVPATNIERARKFYEEKLGLHAPADLGGDHVLYTCGAGTTLLVYQRGEPTKAEHTQASFMVEDIEKEVAELRARGVVFEEYDFPGLKTVNGIASIANEKSAWFKDSEGNILALGQKL